MRTAVLIACVMILAVIVWIGWQFQPWMPAGRAVHVSSGHVGELDFQVWQRKTDLLTEPFATGLFVRKDNGPWKAFLLDFEDTYRPRIVLRMQGAAVEVFRGNNRLGVLQETGQSFKWDSDGAIVSGDDLLGSEPPDDWWLRPEAHFNGARNQK
jgi:hypothetical protein